MNSNHFKKQGYYIFILTVCWFFVLLLFIPYLPVWAEEKADPVFSTSFDLTDIDKNGNVVFQCPAEEFEKAGFDIGDIVSVSFLDQTLDLPYCTHYIDVSAGQPGLFRRSGYLVLALNMQNFALTYQIVSPDKNEDESWNYAEGVSGPVEVSFHMKEKKGYPYAIITALNYSDLRSDYWFFSDEQFANFRAVKTTGMGVNRLYRTASPLDPAHNRSTYAETAIKKAGVTLILNLADTESTVSQFERYESNYYSSIIHKELGLSINVIGEDTKKKLVEGFRLMAQTPGIYAINCLEGKDRTGFAIALLECLMGASYQEVIDDYMVTYYNYYTLTKEDDLYDIIAEKNIKATLENVFGVDELMTADLKAEAEEYLTEGGLDEKTILSLKKNLSANNSIKKAANPITVKTKPVKVSYKKLKKRKIVKNGSTVFLVKKAKGNITFRKISGSKRIIINKRTGKLTIRKNTPKKLYKIKVKITAAGNKNYKKASRTVLLKVKVQ